MRTIENAGHQLAIDNPQSFGSAVSDFLHDESFGFEPRQLERRRVRVRRKNADDFAVLESDSR